MWAVERLDGTCGANLGWGRPRSMSAVGLAIARAPCSPGDGGAADFAVGCGLVADYPALPAIVER